MNKSKGIIILFLVAFLFLPAISSKVSAQGNPNTTVLNASISPSTPVAPGSKVIVSWEVQFGSIGGMCKQVPPVTNEVEQRVIAMDCGNKEGIGGDGSSSKEYTLNETTQFILYTGGSPIQVKAVTAVVSDTAPPTSDEFKIVKADVTPKQVTGGKGTDIKLNWSSTNAAGVTFTITYTTVGEDGKPVNGTDGKPIENKTLDVSKARCENNNVDCTLDIPQFGANNELGATTAGKTTFKIVGATPRGPTSEATAELTVGRGVTADQSDPPPGGTGLFDFLRKVVAYVVLLLTSLIYLIFSTVLVPVLNALLDIRAYEDRFVNFIYPGWIIIRNISNMAFIIALLVMGLKILFQQEDASKSRGFIVTLVLMALLVNFSLVIAQGIVGIADTVQSQFLPAESKVIEALGQKLMVDPIQTFRGVAPDAGINSTATDAPNSSYADLSKPIVLLVLAIAAFFSFVALIAFIFVRLVALWVLYMLSPLAYVGKILPETRKYANEWWTNFIKYAFTVPILAFFLNIAALMAVTFSRSTGDVVQAGRDPDYLLTSVAGNFAEAALTVISHFIVLIFIFIGMKFALSFGGAGAKQIVGAAKKGFDSLTTRPAKWVGNTAKDLTKDYGKAQWQRRFAGGMLDPKTWKDTVKERTATQTKLIKAERLSRKANRLSPGNIIPPEGSLTDRANHIGKYMMAKLRGQDPHKELARANTLKDKAAILTDEERSDLETAKTKNDTLLAKTLTEEQLLNDNKLTNTRAKKYKDEIDDRLSQIAARRVELQQKNKKLDGQGRKDGTEYKNNELEIKGLDKDEAKLNDAKTAILAARTRSGVRNEIELNTDDIDKLSVVFSPADLRGELSDTEKKSKTAKESFEKKITEDDNRRAKYNTPTMTDEDRRILEKQAFDIAENAAKVYMPASYAAMEARRALQSDHAKKVEHMDDVDELVEAFDGAMKKNNTAFATEIAKKLAKIGGMDELLKQNGYNNNLKDFQQFIDKKFSSMAPQVRLQIGSEISTIAKTNGNLTLGNSAKYSYNASTGENIINWAPPEQSKRKLDAKLKGTGGGALAKLEKTDISEQRGGVDYLHQGFVEGLNNLNQNGLNAYMRELPASKRNHIMKAKNYNDINSQVKARLEQKYK